MAATPFSIVCVSSQPWTVDLPTNRQQIMLRAARRGHRILFLESGSFLGVHLWRLLRGGDRRSLARRLLGTEVVAEGIHVRKSLNVLPWGHKYRFTNSVNCRVTRVLLGRAVRRLPRPLVLWIYDPCSADCVGGEEVKVYDCVDDYVEQAGPDERRRDLTAAADQATAETSRLVFATTRPLYARLRRLNARTHHVPNVADYEHFRPAASRSHAAPELQGVARPVVGFAGNLVPTKVDFGLLEALAARKAEWSMVLIGPAADGSLATLDAIDQLPNVRWLGAKTYQELPRYVAAFDVGLIPYASNDYTRSCFPLKLYEYLAAGKPVVATGLPELAGMEPDVALTDGVDGVVAAITSALARLGPDDAARRSALAAQNTWETRTERLLTLVGAELGT